MKKNVIIIIILFFISGCSKYNYDADTVIYKLNIGDYYDEEIVFTFNGEVSSSNYVGLEGYALNIGDNYPMYSDFDEIYDKKVNKSRDKTEVILRYKYAEKEFMYSHNIMNCFENYNVEASDDEFSVSLSGKFLCFQDDKDFELKIISSHPVVESNGNQSDDNYIWFINKTNYDNVDIKYVISRKEKDMKTSISNSNDKINFSGIRNVFLVFLGVILIIFIYKFYKKKKKEIEV